MNVVSTLIPIGKEQARSLPCSPNVRCASHSFVFCARGWCAVAVLLRRKADAPPVASVDLGARLRLGGVVGRLECAEFGELGQSAARTEAEQRRQIGTGGGGKVAQAATTCSSRRCSSACASPTLEHPSSAMPTRPIPCE